MPANFTSGWLGNGERAWHNQGVVTEGTLPAREAFETADALFTVEKRELQCPVYGFDQISIKPSGSFAVVRTDNQDILGIVSQQYEIVQTDALLRMAEFIREEADMDCVVVLADGKKVCFTATLRGTEKDVIPGDTVKRRIIGYLGHDGKTGVGVKFTTIRVVCENTLNFALRSGGAVRGLIHKAGVNNDFQRVIESIDCAREDFNDELVMMEQFAQHQLFGPDFRNFVSEVYDVDIEDLEDGKFKKYAKLQRAYRGGLGQRDFAPGTMWSAINAITEVETSTKAGGAVNARRQFARANFGQGLVISNKAISRARQICEVF